MPKALVIDDEAVLTTVVGRFLERAGFRVETATSGQEGLAKAVAEYRDVVVVDVMMPGMDGYEVCRRLRADPRTARTTIVVLTARGQVVDRQMALQSGADAHAAKPFNGDLLIQDVERLLAGRPANKRPLGYQIAVLRLQEGAGATTLSTNLALSLTREKGYLTAAVDMVLQEGQVARQLGLPGTASRAESPAETADDLVDQLVQHRTGLYVLSALPSQRTSSWDSNLVVEHLGQLRSWCDYVVVDTPRDLGKLAPALLEASHLVLFLLTPDAATLRTARASLAAVRKMGGQTQRIWPIINLVNQAPPSLRRKVEEALGAQVVTVFPWSPEECTLAMARLDPVVRSYPDSPLARACQMLARHITRVAARYPERRTTG